MSERKLEIVHPEIERYMDSLAGFGEPVCDTVLEMEGLARERGFPIVGRLVGRFLFQQALLLGAKRVFEMGSGFGYSAYWFARAACGEVLCTDTSPENAELAGDFMKKAGFEKTVRFHTGDAIDILAKTGGEFDIVFCDIDKEAYPEAFAAARERIRKGGLFLADNAFWDGKAALPDGSPAADGIIKFNKTVVSDMDFFTVQVPLRDGISVSLKLV
ncbi:O-methyltransferase [Candidatus Mycalebacterium sp.]